MPSRGHSREEIQERGIAKDLRAAVAEHDALAQRLPSAGEDDLTSLIDSLAQVFSSVDDTIELRLLAADVLLHPKLRRKDDWYAYAGNLSKSFSHIRQAVHHENPDIRKRALQLLAWIGPSPRVIQELLFALGDPLPDGRLQAITSIGAAFLLSEQRWENAVEVVPQLSELLKLQKDENSDGASKANEGLQNEQEEMEAEIRTETCRVLEHFKTSAVGAIKPLALLVLKANTPDVRLAAAKALAAIDRDGNEIIAALRNVEDVQDLAEFMFSSGVGTSLRDSLRRWIRATERGPRPGFARLEMKDVVRYVFGPPESGEKRTEKQINDSRRKRIEHCMASGVNGTSRTVTGCETGILRKASLV